MSALFSLLEKLAVGLSQEGASPDAAQRVAMGAGLWCWCLGMGAPRASMDALGLERLWPEHALTPMWLERAQQLGEVWATRLKLELKLDTLTLALPKLRYSIEQRRACGAYYTSAALVAPLTRWCLAPHLQGSRGWPTIFDPACGAGAFLLGALLQLVEAGCAAKEALEGCLFGVELDALMASMARAQLLGLGLAKGLALDDVAPAQAQLLDHIFVADSLALTPSPRFDIVLSNPPYAPVQDEALCAQLKARFVSATYKLDLYTIFLELGLAWLKPGGRQGALTPATYLTNSFDEPLRRLLLTQTCVEQLALVTGGQAFEGVSADVAMIVCRAQAPATSSQVGRWQVILPAGQLQAQPQSAQGAFLAQPQARMSLGLDAELTSWLARVDAASVPLSTCCAAYFGMQTRDRKRYVRPWDGVAAPPEGWAPCLDGSHIQAPCALLPATELVSTAPEHCKSGGDPRVQRRDRVVVRQIGQRPVVALAPGGRWSLNTVYNVYVKDGEALSLYALLALLQSELIAQVWRLRFADERRTFPKIKKQALLALPLPRQLTQAPAQSPLHLALRELGLELTQAAADEVDDVRARIEAVLAQLFEVV